MAGKQPRPKRVALTGATGFLGRRVMQLLAESGTEVQALTRRPQRAVNNVTWIAGDLNDLEALGHLTHKASAVIHCAGAIKAVNRNQFFDINVSGTRNIATATLESAPRAHLVLASSLAAREPRLSDYSASKYASEMVLEESGLKKYSILRLPAIYGPGDAETLKLFRAMARGFAPIVGKRSNRFTLLHVDDAARALIATAGEAKLKGQVFEVDSPEAKGCTIDQVAALASGTFERDIRTLTVPASLAKLAGGLAWLGAQIIHRPAMLTHMKARELAHPDWVSANNLLSSTGVWSSEVPMSEGIPATISAHRADGDL